MNSSIYDALGIVLDYVEREWANVGPKELQDAVQTLETWRNQFEN